MEAQLANNLSKQVLEEGWKNAVVKLAGALDTTNVTWAPAIALSDFSNNDRMMGKLVGLRVDEIDYSSGPNLVTSLEWNSATPQLIASFAQSDELEFKPYGGANPNRQISGYDGSINIRTTGYNAGTFESFTVILVLTKIYSQTGL